MPLTYNHVADFIVNRGMGVSGLEDLIQLH